MEPNNKSMNLIKIENFEDFLFSCFQRESSQSVANLILKVEQLWHLIRHRLNHESFLFAISRHLLIQISSHFEVWSQEEVDQYSFRISSILDELEHFPPLDIPQVIQQFEKVFGYGSADVARAYQIYQISGSKSKAVQYLSSAPNSFQAYGLETRVILREKRSLYTSRAEIQELCRQLSLGRQDVAAFIPCIRYPFAQTISIIILKKHRDLNVLDLLKETRVQRLRPISAERILGIVDISKGPFIVDFKTATATSFRSVFQFHY